MHRLKLVLAGVMLASSTMIAADDSRDFEVSGFARVVAGYLNESTASYQGYDDSLSVSEQSLLGLQAEYAFNEQLSVAAQLLAHSGDNRNSGVEWLYVRYEPTPNWRFKAGKLRTPLFKYSDSLDVGFAYPWITPPQQIYSAYFFTNYDGITATYRQFYADTSVDIEAFWGKYEETSNFTGDEIPVGADPLCGLVLRLQRNNLELHAGYIESEDFTADIPELEQFAQTLDFAGFAQSAESLRFDGKADGFVVGLNYNSLDYFVAAEWSKIESDVLLVPSNESFYATVGYNFYPFQVHATYASSEVEYQQASNQIPLGLSPELDQLSFAYDGIIAALPEDELDSITVGIRYDIITNVALKGEVSWLDGAQAERAFFIISDNTFDRQATLYQVAVEWVF